MHGKVLTVGAALALSWACICDAYAPLTGVKVASVKAPGTSLDLGAELKAATSSGKKAVAVLGTYAADFNNIEYMQRIRHYLPKLRSRGVGRVLFVVNGEAEAASKVAEMVDLPGDVELLADPSGAAGRAFGVSRGWKPDDEDLSPYVKLFGMLFGLGAWATLPAVIGGYIGNPFVAQPWIEDALAQGQRAGRWPNTALELDDATGNVNTNKFADLPIVGSWPRRPLELATLRLQNMVDISIKEWDALRPKEDNLQVLTQLGGCLILDTDGTPLVEYKDPGICAVCNFESILDKVG